MLLILAIGGAAASAIHWLQRHPDRVEDELRVLFREAYLELQQERATEVVPSEARKVLGEWDEQYQRFVAERIDPLLSRSRRDHLEEIKSGELLPLTEDERKLNRYIGAAMLGLTTTIVFPSAVIVVLGAAIYCTIPVFRRAYHALVRDRKLKLPVMGSLYVVGAFAGGFYFAGTFGLVVWFMSEKLVLITQDRSQDSLIKIFADQPRTVWLVCDQGEVEVPIENVQAGDTIVVQAGQVVPVDGVITDGIATIDQHMLTGEFQPVEKGEGEWALTSTLVVGGRVQVRVERTGEETIVSQIGAMLNNTANYQASIVAKGLQVADQSVPPTMAVALVAFPLAGFRSTVAILGSSIGMNIKVTAPISMLNFLNVAAGHGILVKDGRSLELLSDVDLVVFDKTGTLTMEQPRIAQIHTSSDLGADEVLAYAAAAEHRQTHPIARAILDSAAERELDVPSVAKAHYEIGFGIRVQLQDQQLLVGSHRYMDMEGVDVPPALDELTEAVKERGNALVMVALSDRLVGAIELEPTLRTEVGDVVGRLRERDIELCIISGDQEEPTRRMAESLGIDRYFANTLPEEKATLVSQLQSEGHSVCFVGDGINDSISLKKANVSVSLRGASTAATDSAQIVLMGEGLRRLPFIFELADEFDRNMRAGLGVAVGQGIVVIGGALLGVVGIVSGALIWTAGLAVGLGIAHIPLWRHRGTPPPPAIETPPPRAELGPGATDEPVGAAPG